MLICLFIQQKLLQSGWQASFLQAAGLLLQARLVLCFTAEFQASVTLTRCMLLLPAAAAMFIKDSHQQSL